MNKFLAIIVTSFVCTSVFASVTVEQATDPEYIINSGFSEAVAEDIIMMKNRVNGEPIEPLYEKNSNIFVKGWKYFYSYLDPSVDNENERYHHNIHLSPHFTDL